MGVDKETDKDLILVVKVKTGTKWRDQRIAQRQDPGLVNEARDLGAFPQSRLV